MNMSRQTSDEAAPGVCIHYAPESRKRNCDAPGNRIAMRDCLSRNGYCVTCSAYEHDPTAHATATDPGDRERWRLWRQGVQRARG